MTKACRIILLVLLPTAFLLAAPTPTPTPTPKPKKGLFSWLKKGDRTKPSPTPKPSPTSTPASKPETSPVAKPSPRPAIHAGVGRGLGRGEEHRTPTPTPTPIPDKKAKSSSASPTPKPSATPRKSASPSPEKSPKKESTPAASVSPSPKPAASPKASATPKIQPSISPTPAPAKAPVELPSATPVAQPKATVAEQPSVDIAPAAPKLSPGAIEIALLKFEPMQGTPNQPGYRNARLSYRINVGGPGKVAFPVIDFSVESSAGQIFSRHYELPAGNDFLEPGPDIERTVSLDPAPGDNWAEVYQKSDRAKFTWSISGKSSGSVEQPVHKAWP